jgi:basic membrane protein A
MTNNPLRLACAALAVLASPALPAAVQERPSVALVLIGPKNDGSWAEAAHRALEAEAQKGSRTAFAESVADADVARVLRDYVDQGFEVIVGHSFSYQDAVFEVAGEAPQTHFAWAGGIGETADNVSDYDQPFYEPAYLVGVLAGHVSPSGRLGALYGFDIPVCHAMGEAMLAGARTVNPEATLTVTAVGDWGDVAAAKEAGLAQADAAGVDYWIGCGEGPTLGSIEAAKETGGYATGYVGDMSELGPETVLASIVWNMEPIFDRLVERTAAGSFEGEFIRYGVKEDALDIVLNPKLAPKVRGAASAAVEEARRAIRAGTLEVPFVPQ